MNYPFKNLVFKAGGVKGIVYGGAIESLHNHKILDNIQRVSGTSAGSIAAVILSLRYSPEEIKEILVSTNFASFMDGWKSPFRLLFKYGFYKGDAFLNWMKTQIANAPNLNLSKEATFKDFKEAGCRDLYIIATDLNRKTIQEFSFETTPDVSVAEAARASMSIPIFFKAWQFPKKKPSSHIYVDGGVMDLYPLNLFDTNKFTDDIINPETLGLTLKNTITTTKPDDLKYGNFFQYIKDGFEALLNQQDLLFDLTPELKERSVIIDSLGVKATDFNLSKEEQQKLVESGKNTTDQWLKKWKPIQGL